MLEPAYPTQPGQSLHLPGFPILESTEMKTAQFVDGIIHEESILVYRYVEILPGDVPLEMIWIPSGTFLMGSPENEQGRRAGESPQHKVTVPGFFMSRYLITEAQWKAVSKLPQVDDESTMDGVLNIEFPWQYLKGDWHPIACVSWDDTVEFCSRLSAYTSRVHRLPSEAEWEYACRGGKTSAFYFGQTISTDLARIELEEYNPELHSELDDPDVYDPETMEFMKFTTEVGFSGYANAFGLYDMHGNLDEWCADDHHRNYEGAPVDGSAWLFADQNNRFATRVVSGGSWLSSKSSCRSASRWFAHQDEAHNTIGVRIVAPMQSSLPSESAKIIS